MQCWDLSVGRHLAVLREDRYSVRSVLYGASGNYLIGLNLIGDLTIWDASTARVAFTFDGPLREEGKRIRLSAAALSPDERRVAVATGEDEVWIADPSTGEKHAVLKGHEGSIRTVAFSPD
ncbi:MAG: WD40 repeat domain-containing protein, partial [Planctomycetota bacterium]